MSGGVRIASSPSSWQQGICMSFTAASEILPLELTARNVTMVLSKGILLACDGSKLVKIDPDTGSHQIAVEGFANLSLSSVNPVTGEIQVNSADGGIQKMNPDTYALSPLLLDQTSQVVMTGHGADEVRFVQCYKRLERVNLEDGAIEAIKTPVNPSNIVPATDGVFFNNSTAIFFWQFGLQAASLMVGHTSAAGEADGVGWRARFGAMKKPVYSGGRFMFVRDHPRKSGLPSRLARINVQTDEVRTIHVEGFDLAADFLNMQVKDDVLFVLVRGCNPNVAGGEGPLLLRSSVHGDHRSTLMQDWREVRLEEPLRQVTFRLADGSVIYFDPRILAARSQYFKGLLTSGCKETADLVVDLGADTGVDRPTLEDILRFIATDTFEPVDKSPEHALKAWTLADKYQMQGLRGLVEEVLCRDLSKHNVLKYLSRVFQTSSPLERACWAFLEEHGREIIRENEHLILELIQDTPQLAHALMMWSAKDDCKRRRKA